MRVFRVGLWLVGIASVAVAALTPLIVPLLFGSDFADAVPIVWILLVAGLPLGGTMVLGPALSASGRPKESARAELTALGLAIPCLIVVLPVLGGIGAALVSLGAYSVNLAIQLRAARRSFHGRYTDYVIPRRSDVRWLAETVRVARRRLGARSAG